MSSIDLYQVLKKIPEVSDEEAKQAAGAETDRLYRIETDLAELRTTTRITLALLLLTLAIVLAPLLQ